jgi:hypothetical protein
MKIDIQRLDERIRKLQEARRIAADPELVSILLDFVSTDAPDAAPVLTPKVDSAFGPRTDRTDELIQNVVKGTTPEQGNSIWPTNVRAAVTKWPKPLGIYDHSGGSPKMPEGYKNHLQPGRLAELELLNGL